MADTKLAQRIPELTKLIEELNLVDRYSAQYGFTELLDYTRTVEHDLRQLQDEVEDEKVRGLIKTAQGELALVLDDPDGFTDGLIVAVLMIGRSALRQSLIHFQELSKE